MTVQPPTREVPFRYAGRTHVVVVYADGAHPDAFVYELAGDALAWRADGWRQGHGWLRYAGSRAVWCAALRALGDDDGGEAAPAAAAPVVL